MHDQFLSCERTLVKNSTAARRYERSRVGGASRLSSGFAGALTAPIMPLSPGFNTRAIANYQRRLFKDGNQHPVTGGRRNRGRQQLTAAWSGNR